MKFLFVFLFSLIFIGSAVAQNENKIIGVWNLTEYVGSGLNDHYHFFSDGKVLFHSNEMDCKKRALGFEGEWKLSGDTLQIRITKEFILTGGKMEISSGSCASDSEITGGKETVFEHDAYLVTYIPIISSVEKDSIKRKFMELGPLRYWLISSDPRTYQ